MNSSGRAQEFGRGRPLPASGRFEGRGATTGCGRLPPNSCGVSRRSHERRLSGSRLDRCRPTPAMRVRGKQPQDRGRVQSPGTSERSAAPRCRTRECGPERYQARRPSQRVLYRGSSTSRPGSPTAAEAMMTTDRCPNTWGGSSAATSTDAHLSAQSALLSSTECSHWSTSAGPP